ncbi:MAG TPA: PIN domain-containing protein [Verrucomicrobiae bacterium]|jgi:predicted nucleic acid-binding protein
MQRNIADASAVIAFLDASDSQNEWAIEQFSHFDFLETCSPALAEMCARLRFAGLEQTLPLKMVRAGFLRVTFDESKNIARVIELMEKYRDLPMDFADACLVAMSEEQKSSVVLTLDSDFKIYRRHGRGHIPTLSP